MALDQSFVGRSYPPTAAYEVGREKIREFAEAIGDENPVYTDSDAAKAFGYPDVIAPPTFAFSITYKAAGAVIADPELGLDYSRVVHGDQKFAHTRPVRAGDRLTVTSTIETIKSLAGNDLLEIRGEVHDASGEHVVTAWTKLVARGTADSATDSAAGPAHDTAPTAATSDPTATTTLTTAATTAPTAPAKNPAKKEA